MQNFEDLMREYSDVDFSIEEITTSLKAYQDRLNANKKELETLEAKKEEVAQKIGDYMVANGLLEETYGNATIAPKKLPDVVVIKNEKELPDTFIKTSTAIKKSVDKTALKKALDEGKPVSGAFLKTDRYSIRFVNVKL